MYQHVLELPESERILFGRYADGWERGDVLALPRPMLSEHAYICGQTGSGKTSIGFLQLLIQLARPFKKAQRDPATNQVLRGPTGKPVFDDLAQNRELWQRERPPIVIFDMKGDPLLFNTARAEAEHNGYPFRFFSIDGEKSSYYFNPLQSLQPRPPTEFCELLLNALDLEHGPGYGEGYYSSQHRAALLRAITTVKRDGVVIRDWQHLFDRLRQSRKRNDGLSKIVRDAAELVTGVYALTYFHQMLSGDRTVSDQSVIHMPRVLEERQMVYFWLPTAEYSQGVREVGKLALYALHSAAKTLHESGRGRQVYVFMDEAQHLAGRNFEKLLTQARGCGISMLLSSQYLEAFRFSKFDLRRVILNCTRVKQYFTLSSKEELEEMAALSGERIEMLRSFSRSVSVSPGLVFDRVTWGYSETDRESRTSRFERDLARQVNMEQMHSLLWVTRDLTTGQLAGVPRLVRSSWPLTWDDKVKRETFLHMEWPSGPTSQRSDTRTAEPVVKKKRKAEGRAAPIKDDLDTLFERVSAGEFGRRIDDVLAEVEVLATKGRDQTPGKEKRSARKPKKTKDSFES